MTCLLSPESDFEGGDLELIAEGKVAKIKKGNSVLKQMKPVGRLVVGVVIGLLILATFGLGDLALSGALSPGHQPVADIPQLVVTSENLTVAVVPLIPSAEIAASIPGQDLPAAIEAQRLISEKGLAELSGNLTGVYGFNIVVREPLTIPDEFYNSERGQYRMKELVDWLMERTDPRHLKTIGVLAQDVYKPEYNFLYGLAKIAGPACVASSSRMGGMVLLPKLTPAERWGSLVGHELGHTLGLIHVENNNSIMQYGDNLTALDRTGTNLATDDRRRLEQLWPIDWQWN